MIYNPDTHKSYFKGLFPVPYLVDESNIEFDGTINYKNLFKKLTPSMVEDNTYNVYYPTYTLKRKILD